MTVFINLSESTSGVDTTQYLVEGGIFDGFTADHLNFRSEPFRIRYKEVINVDQDGNKTFETFTYDIPAHNDVYLNATPYSKPTTSLLPIFSPGADDVFYIHGGFGEAPKIEDFLSSDVYADSDEAGRNFEIALGDFEAFYSAQQEWLNSVRASSVNEIEYRDDTNSNGIHASITYSQSLTVEDIRDWIQDNTVTFQLSGDTLFSQPLEITGSNQNDTLGGGNENDTILGGLGSDTINGGEGDDTIYSFDRAGDGVGDGQVDEIDGGTGLNTIHATSEDRVIIDYPSITAEVILSTDPTVPIAIIKDNLGNDADQIFGEPTFVFNNGRSYHTEDFTNKAANQERLDSLSAQIDRHRDAADALLELAKETASVRLDAYEELAAQQLVSGGQVALGVLEALLPSLGIKVELAKLVLKSAVAQDPDRAALESAAHVSAEISKQLGELSERMARDAIAETAEGALSYYDFVDRPLITAAEVGPLAADFGKITTSAVAKTLEGLILAIDIADAVTAIRSIRAEIDMLDQSFDSFLKSRAEHLKDLQNLEVKLYEERQRDVELPFISYRKVDTDQAKAAYDTAISAAEQDIAAADFSSLLQRTITQVVTAPKPYDVVITPDQPQTLRNTLSEFDGTRIFGFSEDDALIVENAQFTRSDMTVKNGSAILSIDADSTAGSEATIFLEGDFSDGDFITVADGESTAVTFESSSQPTNEYLLSGRLQQVDGKVLSDEMVTFTLDDTEVVATSDDEGQYAFELPQSAFGHLEFSREYQGGDPEIGVSDALEVLRLAVGLEPSWGQAKGFHFVAADIDQDGSVNVSDALDTLRAAVGLEGEAKPRWISFDAETDFSGQTAQSVNVATGVEIAPLTGPQTVDMTAILLGNMAEYA